jgi:hypothetical protein
MSETSPLPGTKVLLLGDSGTGKTYSLRTLVEAGLTPLCLFTENSFDVLGDTDKELLHWCYVPPMTESLDALREMSQRIGTMTYEQITKATDMKRFNDSPWMKMLGALMEFKCERTGKNFGNIASWGTDKVFVIDSLSGLTQASRQNVAGNRPALAPPDYGLAQRQIEGLINQVCTAFRCHFVLIAHAEREIDPVMGGQKIMASTIGKALAPTLPRYFTDSILTKRLGDKFLWDTADGQAVLKARNVPISSTLPPSFVPLIAAWKKRGGVVESPAEQVSAGSPQLEPIKA